MSLVVLYLQVTMQISIYIWAPSSEFVSSSIPSWQILTAHAQPFRGARDLAFCLNVPLVSLLVWASSGGSGETARMRRLAWTFTARISDKYQIRLTRPILSDMLSTYLCPTPFEQKCWASTLVHKIHVQGNPIPYAQTLHFKFPIWGYNINPFIPSLRFFRT